jgi:hypothetical protein
MPNGLATCDGCHGTRGNWASCTTGYGDYDGEVDHCRCECCTGCDACPDCGGCGSYDCDCAGRCHAQVCGCDSFRPPLWMEHSHGG